LSTQVDPTPAVTTSETVELSYREAVRAALEDELDADVSVMLMGEDVATAGGVFKTNEGLAEKFGRERIRNTPICENGFVGVALGMAVTGMRPVVEIMFSDFLPTAGDAIVNELPKFRFMSGGQCVVPLTIRSICGATNRFGAQHSATGESWYIGLPGLKVATAATPASAYGVLRAAIRDDDPVIVFEHRALYGRKGAVARGPEGILPVGEAGVVRTGTDVTIVSTMLMTDRAVAASETLTSEGIDAEVIELRWLRPLDYETILASVAKTGRLVVVEEQVHIGGWGSSVIARCAVDAVPLHAPPCAISMPDHLLIPYAPTLEDLVIPSVDVIASTVRQVLANG
jgi:pyruvate/2-oxoglutarate/acetoin dehydrogenase E1 component